MVRFGSEMEAAVGKRAAAMAAKTKLKQEARKGLADLRFAADLRGVCGGFASEAVLLKKVYDWI